MSKHLVFLIHGMGEQGSTWAKSAIDLLKERYKSFDRLQAGYPVNDTLQFVPILYDDVIETYRTRAQNNLEATLSPIQSGAPTPRVMDTILSLAKRQNKDGFFFTHLMDVVLYRYVATVRQHVQVRVAKSILEKVVPKRGPVRTWSFIAHSLGTSVMHDTLRNMFGNGVYDSEEQNNYTLDGQQFGVHTGLFVANVSRILYPEKHNPPFYSTMIKPSYGRGTGYMRWYLNCNHELDPFPMPRPFAPGEDWVEPQLKGTAFPLYHDIPISLVTDFECACIGALLGQPPCTRALFPACY